MRKNINEMIEILNKVKEEIKCKPKLLEYDDNEIDSLYKNSESATFIWMLNAYVRVKKIDKFDYENIISWIEGIDVSYQIAKSVGFILQYEHKISVIMLFIMTYSSKKYNYFSSFIEENIIFDNIFDINNIDKLIKVLNSKQKDCRYYSNLTNVCEYVINNNLEDIILTKYISNNYDYYDLMKDIGINLYRKSNKDCKLIIEKLVDQNTNNSINLAIIFLENSIENNIKYFEENVDIFISYANDEQYFNKLIRCFISYYSASKNDKIKGKILRLLELIPNKNDESKRIYIENINYNDELPIELEHIFDMIINTSFNKDERVLKEIDNYLYSKKAKFNFDEVFNILKKIFVCNGFKEDFYDFFVSMDSIVNEFKKDYVLNIDKIFNIILKGDVGEFYYGTGLIAYLNIIKDINKENIKIKYTQKQLINIVKSQLYFVIDPREVCQFAFMVYKILPKDKELFIEFYLKEIYKNYPKTSYEIAKNKNISNKLAKTIIEHHNKKIIENETIYNIPDLSPSTKRIYEYNVSMYKRNQTIKKEAEKKSLVSFVSKQTMKYGKKHSYIRENENEDLNYIVSEYNEFSNELELPIIFFRDPLLLIRLQNQYLEERNK